MDDWELVKQFQAGDKQVFKELIDRHKVPVYNFIYRQVGGSRQDTEDLAQETFLRAYQSLPKYKIYQKINFSTWLFTIAVNLCRNYYRSRTRQHKIFVPVPITDLSTVPEPSLSPESTAEQIQTALNSLPEPQRQVLLLCKVENKSYLEVAQILRCSVSSVKSLMFRARISLSRHLNFNRKNNT